MKTPVTDALILEGPVCGPREWIDLYDKLINAHRAMERRAIVAEHQAKASLANNLCPDHRDKQTGRPCLACTIETTTNALKHLAYGGRTGWATRCLDRLVEAHAIPPWRGAP